jgi:UDP-N-acetylmuramate dehydrogenase
MNWIEELKNRGGGALIEGEPLSRHTTFRIGGPADAFFEPAGMDDLAAGLAFLRAEGVKRFVIGQGSNLLFSDAGFRGCVVRIGKGLSAVSESGGLVEAGAGAMLNAVARRTAEKGLAGIESLAGIPGTVGGAVYMNVGAFGQWVSGALESVDYIDESGCRRRLEFSGVNFLNIRYRWSVFQEHQEHVITGARFKLEESDPEKLKEYIEGITEKRKKTQPHGAPSAGSFFKNPPGEPAGLLIDKAGLKGLRVGGAEVSAAHANFIVNAGGATCADVLALAEEVRRRVADVFDVLLEPEVKIIE